MKGILRFVLIWVLSMVLEPYLSRFMAQLSDRAPRGSFVGEVLDEMSGDFASGLVHSVGETVSDLFFGA